MAVAMRWIRTVLALVVPAGRRRFLPRIVETFPLGIEPAATVAVALNLVVAVDRSVRPSDNGPATAIDAGHRTGIVEWLDGWDSRVLCDAGVAA